MIYTTIFASANLDSVDGYIILTRSFVLLPLLYKNELTTKGKADLKTANNED